MSIDQFNALRSALASDVGDEFANDPKRSRRIGSDEFKKAVAARQKAGGVGLDSDTPGVNAAALGKTGALAALGVLQGVASAFAGGMRLGTAAGALASGLSHAFAGAASGFVHAGEGILELVLSPFGKAGGAVGKLASGLGQTLLSALSAGGGIVAAGVKIGVGVSAGIVSGLLSLGSAGIGAVLGGLLGSILPGGGTIAGALLGAGIGGAVAGAVLSALTGIIGSVSSALGSAFSAIGDAFGKVGGAIGDALSSVKSVLSDLIDTGAKFASAMLSVSRGGNLSLGAAGGVASLSQMLTGSPGGLNNVFSGFGHMSQYQGFRLKAFGVAGATGDDPLGDFVKSANAYQHLDPIRRSLLVQGGYGGNEAIGNLFALNAYAPGLAARAATVARQTAITPQEAVQNATLALNLSEVQSQLDRLKTKLLTDLMPAITGTLNVFEKWFTGHEKEIVSGLEAFGAWVYVKLPSYLSLGANAFFDLGKSLASALPAVAEFGKTVYGTFAAVVNGLKTGFGALLTMAGLLTTALGVALGASPLTSALSGRVLSAGLGLTKTGLAVAASPGMDPRGADALLNRLGAAAPMLTKRLQEAQDKTNGFLKGAFGSEAERAADWKKFGPRGAVTVNVNVHTSSTQHHTIDMERMTHTVTEHLATQAVQAFQRAS